MLGASRVAHFFVTNRQSYSTSKLSNDLQQLSTWNDFFRMRTRLKKIGVYYGIPSSLLFLFSETILLSQPLFDPTMTIFGLDPMLMIGLGTVGGTFASFILGSAVGRYIYTSRCPNLATFLDQKQRYFYDRVVRFRANIPPIPTQPNLNMDFHGEKISSIADYRKWLKKQAKFKPVRESLKNISSK